MTNADPSGPGSLQQAIIDANNGGGGTITFSIPGGGNQTIDVDQLPAITSPVVLDGTSQPGYAGTPLITLQGTGSSGFGITLRTTAAGSTVSGLMITGFAAGIVVDDSPGNTIRQDVISGNGGNGVIVTGRHATRNVIAGNEIGTDAAGAADLTNSGYGIVLSGGASSNTIGGTGKAAGNLISGNAYVGIIITGAGTNRNVVAGNLVGTDASGSTSLAGDSDGIDINAGAQFNTIGGTVAAASNVISGSPYNGINIGGPGTSFNVVEGNLIGTNKAGTAALPNADGVHIFGGAANNTIGGTTPGTRNIISGNRENGIDIEGPGTTGNRVRGNSIGTDATGTGPIPNGGDGVLVGNSASNNTIGGTIAKAGNVIAFNQGNGVTVGRKPGESVARVAIYDNAIFENAGLGIDLGDDGVTPNLREGSGPNDHQFFPVLTSATRGKAGTTIWGTLRGPANAFYRIEFYVTVPDPSGFGQGQRLLGFRNVRTSRSGVASFVATFPVAATSGQVATATATDRLGNTSEFSRDVAIRPA